MSLAANLADLAPHAEVRVFEPKTEEERDCHWSFWGSGRHVEALKPACKGTWKRWQLIDHEKKVVCSWKRDEDTVDSKEGKPQRVEMN